jgi:hypothetical protein
MDRVSAPSDLPVLVPVGLVVVFATVAMAASWMSMLGEQGKVLVPGQRPAWAAGDDGLPSAGELRR